MRYSRLFVIAIAVSSSLSLAGSRAEPAADTRLCVIVARRSSRRHSHATAQATAPGGSPPQLSSGVQTTSAPAGSGVCSRQGSGNQRQPKRVLEPVQSLLRSRFRHRANLGPPGCFPGDRPFRFIPSRRSIHPEGPLELQYPPNPENVQCFPSSV